MRTILWFKVSTSLGDWIGWWESTHNPSSTMNDGSSCMMWLPQPPAISAILSGRQHHLPLATPNKSSYR
jgi:hypothetical protein